MDIHRRCDIQKKKELYSKMECWVKVCHPMQFLVKYIQNGIIFTFMLSYPYRMLYAF